MKIFQEAWERYGEVCERFNFTVMQETVQWAMDMVEAHETLGQNKQALALLEQVRSGWIGSMGDTTFLDFDKS